MKTLIINAYPGKNSFVGLLSKRYKEILKNKQYKVKLTNLYDLKFDKVLQEGYSSKQELELDLKKAQKDILWADELVFFYPIWWNEMPSLMRSFIERTFLPGFAFKYTDGKPKKLLKGKKAKIFAIAGGPKSYYNTISFIDQKRTLGIIMRFCGIKLNLFGSIKIFGGVRKNISDKYKDKIIKSLNKF